MTVSMEIKNSENDNRDVQVHNAIKEGDISRISELIEKGTGQHQNDNMHLTRRWLHDKKKERFTMWLVLFHTPLYHLKHFCICVTSLQTKSQMTGFSQCIYL